jgi:hypothetical protein
MPVARSTTSSRPAVMIRAVLPSGATAKVSAAFGSTAPVTDAENFAVALPLLASSESMLPAEVSASSSPSLARGEAGHPRRARSRTHRVRLS